MNFAYENRRYRIEFQRDKKRLQRPGTPEVSRFPYTTARLLEFDEVAKEYKVVASASVGCWHKEPRFTREEGRLKALRKLTDKLPTDLKPRLWETYHNRFTEVPKNKVLEGEIVGEPV